MAQENKLLICMKGCVDNTKICCEKTKFCCKKTRICCKNVSKKTNIFCGKLCTGRTHCAINIICFLPVLIYLSIKIYLLPCIGVILGRIFTFICCFWCRIWCPEDYIFTDNQFPANINSLKLKDVELEKSILWIRASELSNDDQKQMYLFKNGIVPSDIVQGKLGNCWLMAAIASLAEFPGAIENVFYSYKTNERHKYYVKLYDARRGIKAWRKFYIDDYIPCHRTTKEPVFANPNDNEMYVLLLEKAFAKFCGNYGRLDGGHTLWAFQAMTGCYCMRLEYDQQNGNNDQEEEEQYDDQEEEEEAEEEDDEEEDEEEDDDEEVDDEYETKDDDEEIFGPCWRKWQIEYDYPSKKDGEDDDPRHDYGWIDSGEAFDNKKLWHLLKKYDGYDALISAGINGKNGEDKRDDGIVEGHAYTVKQIFQFKKHKLMNLRNPWGQFEWNGKWSDNDEKTWKKHKKIAEKIKFVAENDGSFWICYEDFLKIFNVIEICDRTTISNLHLNTTFEDQDEDSKYKLSIIKVCFNDCFKYWCYCKGLRNVYFGRNESSKETIETENKLLTICCPFIEQDHGQQSRSKE